jgi:hypothetical protein
VRKLDVLGPAEVAGHLGVNAATVRSWAKRGILPPPDAQLQIGALWRRATIDRWAASTGRARVRQLQQL